MASTSIFAPQVKSVQPAFVYNSGDKTGKVKIYFSFSSYNNINEIQGIFYTLVDPNLASTWGDNSMIVADFKYRYVSSFTEEENGEYSFVINFNSTDFKELTKNQYYQMQLYFVDANTSEIEESQTWFNSNQQYISEPSQITLIRPINEITITFDLPAADDKGIISTYHFTGLKGHINSTEVETLDNCYCEYNMLLLPFYFYPTSSFQGVSFEIPLPFVAESNDDIYEIIFHYTTIHGYKQSTTLKIKHLPPIVDTNGPEMELTNTIDAMGMVLINVTNLAIGDNSNWIIQKSSDQGSWQDLIKKEALGNNNEYYGDVLIESDVFYCYRIIKQNNDNTFSTSGTLTDVKVNFDHILLSNPDYMVPIRFNPNISNLKYVTQESITNTLGGKYPIIRKNGDTKYKQFTLSGSLFIDLSANEFFIPTTNEPEPSLSIYTNILGEDTLLSSDFVEYEWSFYIGGNDSMVFMVLGDYQKALLSLVSKVGDIRSKNKIESKFRDIVVDFLYDHRPKLFRSEEEGNMIVSLSNISLTPNRQLGRHIYDFSATVTEVCEYTLENLQKYNLDRSYLPGAITFPLIDSSSVTAQSNTFANMGIKDSINRS